MTSDQHQHPPWDSGLQAERTSLSWQRVNLAGLACGLVSARLLIETHPLAGYSLAVLTAVGACLLNYLPPQLRGTLAPSVRAVMQRGTKRRVR